MHLSRSRTISFSGRRTRLRNRLPSSYGVSGRLRRGRLSAGGFGCGDDLVEARITQRIPARIEAESAVCRASRDLRGNFESLERSVALARPRVNQRQVGSPDWTVGPNYPILIKCAARSALFMSR